MKASESRRQPDLFATEDEKEPLFGYTSPDYILEYRRPELQRMLQMVREADVFPWPNLTKAMCEEMRFNGLARLLPKEEGMAMLEAFAVEIDRLYKLRGEPWMPLFYAVLKTQYAC